MPYTASHQLRKRERNMSIIKGLFGGKKAQPVQDERIRSISVAPGQTQEEIDQNRARMEAELEASRAARAAKTESTQ